MTRALGVALMFTLLWAAYPSSAPQTRDRPATGDVVSTWTLTTLTFKGPSGQEVDLLASP